MLLPGVVPLLLFLVFTYLYQQSRQPYFRAWQLAWAAYALHFALDTWSKAWGHIAAVDFAGSLLLVAMAFCIVVSTRLTRRLTSSERRVAFQPRWDELLVAGALVVLALWDARFFLGDASSPNLHLRLGVGFAAVLAYSSLHFYLTAQRRSSPAFYLLFISLAFWSALMFVGQFKPALSQMLGVAGQLGPVPQLLLGIAMAMVLFENERNAVQENALAFSTLGVDPMRLLSATDLVPSMRSILDRLVAPLPTGRAVICISERWRAVLPSVQIGFSPGFATDLDASGAGEYVCELAYRRGGFVAFPNLADMAEPLPAFPGGRFEQFRHAMAAENIGHVTAVSLQTREHNFGVILFPHAERTLFGASNLRLLIGLALQIGLTLENYVIMHDAQRRTKEYLLLTQIGQAISSRLNQQEVLRAVQKELGQIFDTSNFYVTFQEGDSIVFHLEVEDGQILPRRQRKVSNGLTEYMLRTGQPLLIRSDLERARERLGVTFVPKRPAKSFCGAPILVNGKATGVMAAMSITREYIFEQRDLDVLKTAAGQVSVAIENARLFSEEQRRAHQFAFLNSVSKTAISSDDAEQMLAEIVAHIQKNFHFDHIGIGLLDYATKEIEIKAEAGTTAHEKGKKIAVTSGIIGRVARTGEVAMMLISPESPQGLLPTARSVLCIPITYGESLLGVLNVESERENAFSSEDRLVMNTLADLLATALHNSFVFQKLQQQSITDSLTSIKTRRFFWEALTSEWKRASRSGRSFSVVLIDLDKFKEVNDTFGHMEGDLVLARVGRLLEQKCRQSNVVARYGGDEFVILMPETTVEQAQILAERLRLWLATDPMLNEHHITGSFGVASFPVHGFSAEDIIRVADAGMYVSKKAGGDRVSTAEDYSNIGQPSASQRQQVSSYIEHFLQRERTAPEQIDELVAALRQLSSGSEPRDIPLLRSSIETLARAAESREPNASGHGDATAQYAEIIGRALGFSADDLRDLAFAARVHDVGKILLPEQILKKESALSEEDFNFVKMHPRLGAEIVASLPNSERMTKAIECHHERVDGTGYPAALKGEDIPLWGRVIAVADAYVNLISDRSLAPGKSSDQALSELEKSSGTRFDGMLVRVLARELKTERSLPGIN